MMMRAKANARLWTELFQLYIICVLINGSSQICTVPDPNVFPTTSSMTSFTSPGYGGGTGMYIPLMDCFWLIDAGANYLQLLIFMTYDTSCPGDKIFIYNGDIMAGATCGAGDAHSSGAPDLAFGFCEGNANTDPALANGVCGTPSAPSPYSTTQRYARIEMVTDAAIEKAGFQIDVVATKDHSGTGCTATQAITATTAYQFLSTKNFPAKYDSSSNCRWTLTSPDGYLEIDVIVSDVEDDNPTSCDYDKYMIYDGANKCDHNNIQMICSEYPKVSAYSLNSTESIVTVTMESDGSVNRRGFLLRYRSVAIPTTTVTTTTVTTTTATPTTTSFIAAVSTTGSATSANNSQLLEMNVELLVGIVFGSLLLISFTIVTVVVVVKKVSIPLEKTITPIQPYRPRPPPDVTARPRKPNVSSRRSQLAKPIHTIPSSRTITAW